MSKVWIIEEGDYYNPTLKGIFSTKEKAYRYYELHKDDRFTYLLKPREYELDQLLKPYMGTVGEVI